MNPPDPRAISAADKYCETLESNECLPLDVANGFLAGVAWARDAAGPAESPAPPASPPPEVEILREALREFDDDENWLIEGSYRDRPSKTGSGDMVFIGKWDPRVFASHALAGTPLPNTEEEHRRKLSAFYEPGKMASHAAETRIKELEALLAEAKQQGRAEAFREANIYTDHAYAVRD